MKNLTYRGSSQATYLASCVVAVLLFTGCVTSGASSRQLARVAKDWCLTIRASQVLPVYPLTEDLQPGDVFVVETSIEGQIKEYEKDGFLPLENLLTRLKPEGYKLLYDEGTYHTGGGNLPHNWQFPKNSDKTDWASAPRAAFPSYSFTIKKGGGLNLAIPVHAVPFGLSLLKTANAHGSIELADAYTYGTDINSLEKQVRKWAVENVASLKPFAPVPDPKDPTAEPQRYFLRLVTRVYLVGRVNVSVTNDEASGASVSAGQAKPVGSLDLFSEKTTDGKDTTESALGAYKSINESLKDSLTGEPGVSLKLVAASSRSVSLVETFPRPLVVGYIGCDMEIQRNAELGTCRSTSSRLSMDSGLLPSVVYGPDLNTEKLRSWLAKDPKNRQELRDWLKTQGYDRVSIPYVENGIEYECLRGRIIDQFHIP